MPLSLFPELTPDDPPFRDLRQEVYELLEARGAVTKDDIDLLLAPTAEEYAALRESLLQMPRVSARPGKAGGFVLGDARGTGTTDEDGAEPTLSADEAATVDRLLSLLRAKELAELVGDEIRGELRSIRRIQSGTKVDRPLRQRELAIALVIKYGNDLLAQPKVRELVGRQVNQERTKQGLPRVDVPSRWHPGKQSAIAFVTACGFPAILQGVPVDERPKDYEFLQGRVDLHPLQGFQIEVKRRMLAVLTSRGGRAIVTLPTGAGKTRTAVEALREWLTQRHHDSRTSSQNVVLWLAHTEELCEQAYSCFRQVWETAVGACPIYLVRFWGRYTADLVGHRDTLQAAMQASSVFVSTPQRFANLIKEGSDEAQWAVACLRNGVRAVVVDEAHRAAAPSYQQILSLFEGVGDASVIGLTATPFRTEYAEDGMAGTLLLAKLFFSQIVEPQVTLGADPRAKLQEMEVLARPVLETLHTGVRLTLPPGLDLANPTQEALERADMALRLKADASAARRLALTEKLVSICESGSEHSVLYFGPSVADAATVAFLVRERGHRAAFVSGNTPEPVRRQVIDEFRTGAVRVLCNCEVLTTGFDAPRVSHVVVGRPTLSQVLYEQMVGRGLRGPKFGGTAHCVIVNCVDDYRATTPAFGWVGWRDAWKPETR